MIKSDHTQKITNLASDLLYRGEVTHYQAVNAIDHIRNNRSLYSEISDTIYNFLSLNNQKPIIENINGSQYHETDRACCLLNNSTAILPLLDRLIKKYDILFDKRAYIHYYTMQGMEMSEFITCRDKLLKIMNTYRSL